MQHPQHDLCFIYLFNHVIIKMSFISHQLVAICVLKKVCRNMLWNTSHIPPVVFVLSFELDSNRETFLKLHYIRSWVSLNICLPPADKNKKDPPRRKKNTVITHAWHNCLRLSLLIAKSEHLVIICARRRR